MRLSTALRLGEAACSSGYHRVFVGEDAKGEIFTRLAVLALKLGSPALASGILSPFRHSLVEIASCTAGIQRLTSGRFSLGIGPGERRGAGTLEGMKEALRCLRGLLRGETVRSEYFRIKEWKMNISCDTEILMGVRGRNMLALAGKAADGVILSFPLSHLPLALEHLRRSAGRRYRKMSRILWLPVALGEIEEARKVAAVIISDTPACYFGGYAKLAAQIAREVRRNRLAEACRMLPEELLEELCVTSVEGLQEAKRQAERLGITELILGPPFGSEQAEVVRRLAAA